MKSLLCLCLAVLPCFSVIVFKNGKRLVGPPILEGEKLSTFLGRMQNSGNPLNEAELSEASLGELRPVLEAYLNDQASGEMPLNLIAWCIQHPEAWPLISVKQLPRLITPQRAIEALVAKQLQKDVVEVRKALILSLGINPNSSETTSKAFLDAFVQLIEQLSPLQRAFYRMMSKLINDRAGLTVDSDLELDGPLGRWCLAIFEKALTLKSDAYKAAEKAKDEAKLEVLRREQDAARKALQKSTNWSVILKSLKPATSSTTSSLTTTTSTSITVPTYTSTTATATTTTIGTTSTAKCTQTTFTGKKDTVNEKKKHTFAPKVIPLKNVVNIIDDVEEKPKQKSVIEVLDDNDKDDVKEKKEKEPEVKKNKLVNLLDDDDVEAEPKLQAVSSVNPRNNSVMDLVSDDDDDRAPKEIDLVSDTDEEEDVQLFKRSKKRSREEEAEERPLKKSKKEEEEEEEQTCFVPEDIEEEPEDLDQVLNSIRRLPGDKVLGKLPNNVEIKVSALLGRVLRFDEWLDDEAINYFTGMLQLKFSDTLHCLQTPFYPIIQKQGVEKVRKWLQKVDKSLTVYLPVHLGAHWTLAVFKPKEREITYVDSYHNLTGDVRDNLIAFANMHWGAENNNELEWHVKELYGPTQTNSVDCGVFTCLAAWSLMHNVPLTYTEASMPHYRRLLAYHIIKDALSRSK